MHSCRRARRAAHPLWPSRRRATSQPLIQSHRKPPALHPRTHTLPAVAAEDEDDQDGEPEEADEDDARADSETATLVDGVPIGVVAAPPIDPVASARSLAHRAFLARALLALDTLLRATPDREALIAKLQHLPICPLVDGRFVPCRGHATQTPVESDSHVLMRDPPSDSSSPDPLAPVLPWTRVLEERLLILHPDVFQTLAHLPVASSSARSSSSGSTPHPVAVVRSLLLELGLKPVDDHFVLQSALAKMRQIAASMEVRSSAPPLVDLAAAREARRRRVARLQPRRVKQRKDLAQYAVVELAYGLAHLRDSLPPGTLPGAVRAG